MILPTVFIDRLRDKYNKLHLKKVSFEEYNLKTSIMGIDKLKNLLKKGGFID